MAKGKRFVRRKPGNNGALQRRAQKQKTQDADVSMIASTVNSDSESDLDGQTRVRKRVRWDAVEEGIQDDGAEKESADAGSVRDDDTVEADEGVDEKVSNYQLRLSTFLRPMDRWSWQYSVRSLYRYFLINSAAG